MSRPGLLLWTALGLALAGCSTNDQTDTRPAEQVIDEPLMLCLNQIKNHHRIAKIYLSDGQADRAIPEVEKILTVRCPPEAPEVQELRLDARALLGRILLGQQRADEALRVVEDGIASATRDSFFLANLHTVRGELLEALERKREAIEAYERANEIDLKLQRELFP